MCFYSLWTCRLFWSQARKLAWLRKAHTRPFFISRKNRRTRRAPPQFCEWVSLNLCKSNYYYKLFQSISFERERNYEHKVKYGNKLWKCCFVQKMFFGPWKGIRYNPGTGKVLFCELVPVYTFSCVPKKNIITRSEDC